jgi:hypothetical protein
MPKGFYPIDRHASGPRLSLFDRFWSKVEKTDTCWLWTGALFANGLGYGQFQMNGRPQTAHRVAWYLAHGGEWPKQDLAHSCDVPRCVRIEHLREATPLENNRDMTSKGRHPNTGKLTDQQCREIRERVLYGPRGTARACAREYGVSEGLVSRIVHGKRQIT